MLQATQRVVVGTMIIAGLTLTGCTEKKQQAGPMGPPEVSFLAVKEERVSLTTELPGRTNAMATAEVRPQVGGLIKKRLYPEGGLVKAGQTLYQIEPASYEASLASARAVQARAEATLGTVRMKAGRYADLVKTNAVSRQDNDDAQASLKQAEAEVAAAKAAVETARINLAYTKVTAPISGRIGRSSVTEGALVTANQPQALATIQQMGSMYVDITQSSADLLKLKQRRLAGKGAGQAPVSLILEDGTPYPHKGTLKFTEVTVDQSTGSVTLRAVFPNPNQMLLPGMFVRALIQEGIQEKGILVPQRGLSRNPKGDATVLVVGAEEKVEVRVVKTDRTVGENWLVTAGLKPGDRVILEGVQRARPGTPVKAVPFGQGPASAGASPASAGQPAQTQKAPAAGTTQPQGATK